MAETTAASGHEEGLATPRGVPVAVRLVGVTKRFGDTVAVDRVDLEVRPGEFFTLLGPSGCGKTTTLRMVAGFVEPDSGDVYFGERRMNGVPPWSRQTGMVFQNYALWPHLTVFENVAFGLRERRVSGHLLQRKVRAALELVGLAGFEKRRPSQLSGGQQQRVALARTLVVEPAVLLLDEPLSNLDAKLRWQMREELVRLQRQLGITTICVTHDQEEALALSDRIAVMRDGRILQVGTPQEIYQAPSHPFVAEFVGVANRLEGVVEEVVRPGAQAGPGASGPGDDGSGTSRAALYRVRTRLGVTIWAARAGRSGLGPGEPVVAVVRPEAVVIVVGLAAGVGSEPTLNRIDGQVRLATYLGDVLQYEVVLEDGSVFRANVVNPRDHHPRGVGSSVQLTFDPKDVVLV